MIRTYSELKQIKDFKGRYEYLRIGGKVGESSFGFDRYLNQILYRSKPWLSVRDKIIVRDDGLDLGLKGYPIGGSVIVHHMNPLTVDDIEDGNPDVFDPRYLICVSGATHNAIHFGDVTLLPKLPVERRQGDTCPWR